MVDFPNMRMKFGMLASSEPHKLHSISFMVSSYIHGYGELQTVGLHGFLVDRFDVKLSRPVTLMMPESETLCFGLLDEPDGKCLEVMRRE